MTQEFLCKNCGKVFDGRKQGMASHEGGYVCGPKCALALVAFERYFKPIKLAAETGVTVADQKAGMEPLFE